MENQSEKPSENPLETIKNIENTLNLLKTKIMCLEKQEVRTATHIQKLFTSSIPIIKNKIVQSQHVVQKQKAKRSMHSTHKKQGQMIHESRLQHQDEMARTKKLLANSKAFQSIYVKEISKKNNEKIAQIKQNIMKENKQKNQQIKYEKMKSRNKIEEYHIIKQKLKQSRKYQMKKEREIESMEWNRRIERASIAMKTLMKQEAAATEKANANKEILLKLKKMVGYLYQVKQEKFLSIVQQLGLGEETRLDDNLLERILDEIEVLMQDEEQQKIIKTNIKNKKIQLRHIIESKMHTEDNVGSVSKFRMMSSFSGGVSSVR